MRTLESEGEVSANEFAYLILMFLEPLSFAASDSDSELLRISAAMESIRIAHGLGDDEDWYLDESPQEYQALSEEWDARDDALRIEALRAMGHDDLARRIESDSAEFEASGALGHRELMGDLNDPF